MSNIAQIRGVTLWREEPLKTVDELGSDPGAAGPLRDSQLGPNCQG